MTTHFDERITSDYIPINKKKYVNRLIKLEAENRALKKKLKVFEDILISRSKQLPYKACGETMKDNKDDIIDYPMDLRHDDETLTFKKNVFTFIKAPDENPQLVTPLINHIVKPKPSIVKEMDIRKFLTDF